MGVDAEADGDAGPPDDAHREGRARRCALLLAEARRRMLAERPASSARASKQHLKMILCFFVVTPPTALPLPPLPNRCEVAKGRLCLDLSVKCCLTQHLAENDSPREGDGGVAQIRKNKLKGTLFNAHVSGQAPPKYAKTSHN